MMYRAGDQTSPDGYRSPMLAKSVANQRLRTFERRYIEPSGTSRHRPLKSFTIRYQLQSRMY